MSIFVTEVEPAIFWPAPLLSKVKYVIYVYNKMAAAGNESQLLPLGKFSSFLFYFVGNTCRFEKKIAKDEARKVSRVN